VISRGYAVVTLHRPGNVDCPGRLEPLLRSLARIAAELPVIFPVHPRTARHLAAPHLAGMLDRAGVIRLPAIGYLDMLSLTREARLVLTDSGGLQEETTALDVPCLTLRDNTERPVTVDQGSNRLVGTDPARIAAGVAAVLQGAWPRGRMPALWEGRAAERIAGAIVAWLAGRRAAA
jgi:UDP-N-acetylglucosamine 2-epimerase (non-hydrolysing)